MGSSQDYVPTQLTKAYREAQSDEKFQSWLKMQEAVMEIEFPYHDLPEVRDHMFTKDSLTTIENKLLDLYPNERAAYATPEDVHRTMRYVYYIGETFRRAFEATWAAFPHHDPAAPSRAAKPVIDFPFREAFIRPTDLLGIALNRRTGTEISRVFGYAERDYNEWLDNGRPERTFLGTLREED
ncbi:hypothetical protein [Mycolicibacterium fortuitum]